LPRPGPLLHDLSQVLYLPFDRDDGSYARDRSGYNNHGTIYGATLVAGKIGMARRFDGVDDYVEVPREGLPTFKNKLTIGGWVYVYVLKDLEGFIALGDPTYQVFILTPRFADGTLQVIMYTDAYYSALTTKKIVAAEWYHVFFTYDGNLPEKQGKLYVNGEIWVEFDVTGDLRTTVDPIRIGRKTDYYLDGVIDEVRIHNLALSEAEIAKIMHMRGI